MGENKMTAGRLTGKRAEKPHQLKYEVVRVLMMNIVILAAVFVITMVLELHMLSEVRRIIGDNTIFTGYYESLDTLGTSLNEYINSRSEESRSQSETAAAEFYESNVQLDKAFTSPEFSDNRKLANHYLDTADQLLHGSDDSETLLELYSESLILRGYLEENEEWLSKASIKVTVNRYQTLLAIWKRQLLLTIVSIALCGTYLLIFSNIRVRRIVKPISDLTREMKNFQREPKADEHRIPEQPKTGMTERSQMVEETEILQRTFEEMKRTILKQTSELKEKMKLDEELHKSQVQNLQMQVSLSNTKMQLTQSLISPHFLYNCLNTVAGMAYSEKAEKTRTVTIMTAGYLRNSIRLIGKTITLDEEIAHAQSYIDIQHLRFRDRICFETETDDMDGSMKVPSMLLQPLIENSISHGMKSLLRGGIIQTTVRTDPEHIYIRVWDNGTGMKKEDLDRLRTDLSEVMSTERITGLYGIALRLHIFYEGKADIAINSSREEGTEVKLSLPAKIPADRDGKMMF